MKVQCSRSTCGSWILYFLTNEHALRTIVSSIYMVLLLHLEVTVYVVSLSLIIIRSGTLNSKKNSEMSLKSLLKSH